MNSIFRSSTESHAQSFSRSEGDRNPSAHGVGFQVRLQPTGERWKLDKVGLFATFFVFMIVLSVRMTNAQSLKADTIVNFLIQSALSSSRASRMDAHQLLKRDSLEQKIAHAANDTASALALLTLGDFYLTEVRDFNLASKAYDSALFYSDQLSGTKIPTDAYWGLGNTYYDDGSYIESIKAYEDAYAALESSGGSKAEIVKLQSRLLVNLGALYTLINEWEEGQQYYFKSIAKLEEAKDSTSLAITYYNISYLFSDMNDWEKSYEYIKKSMPYRSEKFYHTIVNNCRMAYVCVQLKQLNEAATYMALADKEINTIDQFPEYRRNLIRIQYYATKGMYDHAKGRNILATQYLLRAYKEAVLYEDPYWVGVQARELGLLYFHTSNWDEAKIFFEIGLQVAKHFDYRPQVLAIYSDLSQLAKAQGDWEQALNYRNTQLQFYDSLIKKQNHYRVSLNDARFQAERRQNEISQLKKDNQIQALKAGQNKIVIYSLVAISVLLVFSGVITYRNLRQKQNLLEQNEKLQIQRINQLESEKQLMASEAVIKGQEEERGRLAKDLHDGLGGLLSGVKFSLMNMKSNVILNEENTLMFERSLDMLDHSITELRRVAHNMMPEVLVKFGLGEAVKSYSDALSQAQIFAVNYQVIGLLERLPPNMEIILFRIIQELLNNASKHAKATHVLIQLAQHEKELNITIEDNGVGFDPDNLSGLHGSGLANIRSRIDYLKGKMDIQSSSGKGTSVLLTIHVP